MGDAHYHIKEQSIGAIECKITAYFIDIMNMACKNTK